MMKWLAVPEDCKLGLKREKDKTKLTRDEPWDSMSGVRVRQIAQLKDFCISAHSVDNKAEKVVAIVQENDVQFAITET